MKNIGTWSSEKIQDKLGIVLERSQQIGKDIRQFISCSPNSEKEFSVSRFDLKKLIRHTIERHTNDTRHRITPLFETDKTEITGNPFHIEHMVDNLISNAIKYTDEQQEIYISCRKGKRGKWIIKVKNSGNGTAVQKENGLSPQSHRPGLTYIRNAILQHKGRFQIESKIGKGSECTLVFKTECNPQSKGPSPYIYHCFTSVLGLPCLPGA